MRRLGWKRRLLSWFYPERCPFCGDAIVAGSAMCDSCREQRPYQPLPLCPQCGRSRESCICGGRARTTDRIVAPFIYTGIARQAVQRLKNGVSPEETRVLAAEMVWLAARELEGETIDAVTFVPMTKKERRRRGENAVKRLAAEVAAIWELPLCPVLVKIRETRPQKELGAMERAGNVRGAMDVPAEAVSLVRGRSFLLVDDVCTTGATLEECAMILKIYGAKAVYGLTLAATHLPKQEKEMNTDGGDSTRN